MKSKTIYKCYKKLIKKLLKSKTVENTKEINNCCLQITKPSLQFSLPYRKLSDTYSDAELKWYWSGDNSCETIGKYAKMWLKLSDDGKTNNSAYGYILFKKYGFNQLEQIINLLKQSPNTRRAVLNISDPTVDRINTHDMQCTIAIQFLIRNNKLHETVYMRSNDVYFGLPYDYIFFMTLMYYIADKLKLQIGTYTHYATSMHIYLKDEEKFKNHHRFTYNINWKEYMKYYEE